MDAPLAVRFSRLFPFASDVAVKHIGRKMTFLTLGAATAEMRQHLKDSFFTPVACFRTFNDQGTVKIIVIVHFTWMFIYTQSPLLTRRVETVL